MNCCSRSVLDKCQKVCFPKGVGELAGGAEHTVAGRKGPLKWRLWQQWVVWHQQASWNLLPKLFRDYGNEARRERDRIEDEIREEFASRAPILSDEFRTGTSDWDQYLMMQHFGAPTRTNKASTTRPERRIKPDLMLTDRMRALLLKPFHPKKTEPGAICMQPDRDSLH